jgi:hypothetical protein
LEAGLNAGLSLTGPALKGLTSAVLGIRAARLAGDAVAVEKAVAKAEQLAANAQRGNVAHNAASAEKYKDAILKSMNKPNVSDAQLQKMVNELFRDGAKIGNGSTAAAVRFEIQTGQQVGGAWHSQKAKDKITELTRWVSQNASTSRSSDVSAANQLIRDLQNALKGN